jgi:hypothetical protein
MAISTAAQAQVGAPPQMARVRGRVTALSPSAMTLTGADGQPVTVALLPDWSVIVAKPISVEAIQPGSYLGTTNHAKPDGTGVSTEVHVSPPGATGPGVDYVMDRVAQTTMTNGVVDTVVQSTDGRVLTVDYGHGVRRITVPPGAPVILNSPGDRSLVKVGLTVRVINFTPSTGGPTRQFVTVGDQGAPPPD